MATSLTAGDFATCLDLVRQAPTLNHRMVNMAFSAAVGAGHNVDNAAEDMLKACTAAGLTPTPAMYNNVLSHVAKKAPPEAVIVWLGRMRDAKVPIDRVACNIQLKSLAALGDLPGCIELLSTMMRDVVGGPPTPDAISFNTVISALANTPGYAEKAEKLIMTMVDSGFEADTRSYTGVIVGFARASRPSQAGKWIDRMFQRNLQPDTVTFNAVLLSYANAGDAEGAFKMLKRIEETARADCPNARPDVVSYNTLLQACAKSGMATQAEEVFERIENNGLEPTQITFSTVLNAHARAGNPVKAQAWLDRLVKAGHAADAVSYNSVCAAHARVGDATSALAVFDRMGKAGVAASATTRAILVNALVQSNRAEEAERMLHALVSSGEMMQASSFNPLLSLHAKAGRPERALAILKLMEHAQVAPSLVTFNALASAYAHNGDLVQTEDALNQAKELGHVLDRYSYGALLQAAAKVARGPADKRAAGKAAATRYVEAMLKSGLVLNDFLQGAARRAVGDRTFAELSERFQPSARQTRHTPVAVVAAPAEDKPAPSADGWETVTSKSRKRGGGDAKGKQAERLAARESGRSWAGTAAKSPIKKDRAPPPKVDTGIPRRASRDRLLSHDEEGGPAAAADVRLVGVPLTRSKSERARLLMLAQDVAAAIDDEGVPMTRSKSSDKDLLLLSSGVPLRRSAASELAITLGEDMRL